jgi:hypothetical protein
MGITVVVVVVVVGWSCNKKKKTKERKKRILFKQRFTEGYWWILLDCGLSYCRRRWVAIGCVNELRKRRGGREGGREGGPVEFGM